MDPLSGWAPKVSALADRILYAIARPEIEQAPTRRQILVFMCAILVLAVIPTGSTNNVGTY